MIKYVQEQIKKLFKDDTSGHDYWHSFRVYKTALKIAENESCDKDIISLAALLHDVDDVKLFPDVQYGNARRIMEDAGVEEKVAEQVGDVISCVSFKGNESVVPETLEGKIVQDADRLDAMGAIGIARCFAYGGNRGRKLYDPEILPELDMDAQVYLQNEGTSVNHFYEKLFRLKDMMNTEQARKIAEERDRFLHQYLELFLKEWNE